ncbi:MAG: Inner membrane protein YrbG [Syntrophomonadaceae bacterium]|nr:Inner membrane protein YrbG [Bacillota bacterium]
MTELLFILGLLFLIAGAEILVRGASRLAVAAGISPLIIGLTVVAYGTSSPELAVSVMSAVSGQADIALGNVIGSNIFNVLFILGVSALIVPLIVSQQLVRLDVPLMIAVSVLLLLIGLDGNISRPDGLLLLAGLVAYTFFLFYHNNRENKKAQTNCTKPANKKNITLKAWATDIFFIVSGLGLLILGSQWLIDGATVFASRLGISELIIGLTIVAAGTSLPEVATSVIASIRGERDIAVGNVVGSNIFNILAVLGLSGLLSPNGINVAPAVLGFDLPIMIAVAVACLPVFFTGHLIARWEGLLFLGYYAAYILYLFLYSSAHSALPLFSSVMLLYVIPLTVLTLVLVVIRTVRNRSRNNRPASGGKVS